MKSLKLLVGSVVVVVGVWAGNAAVLTSVPMQGGMVMPMVSYHAEEGHVHVMMPMDVPELTPLMVSNPGDGFDPADPWYGALDPRGQGASFSRRYGFVMDAATDPLPAGRQIWIRKLSGPAELRIYAYSGNAPKMFQPIFGTDGAPAARAWNGMMFHPVFAAPPGTNRLTAVFEVYVVETATGREIPGSASDRLEFTWTNVPDGRPSLAISSRIVVAWSAETAAKWVLESTSSVEAGPWSVVTNTPVVLDGQPAIVVEGAAAQRYFRMRAAE